MSRRTFLRDIGALYCAGSFGFARPEKDDQRVPGLERFKVGAISDGFSQNFEEALQIMRGYGLAWVEIRQVFGTYNTEATTEQVKRLKETVLRYGFRVSVIDTAVYKCTLPGTQPFKGEKTKFDFTRQMDLLKRAMDRADALGTDKIRVFTFWRVAHPQEITERIAAELQKAAEVASRAKMRLVIENEESCNAATGLELARILALTSAPNLGVNWDVGNGYAQGEVSFPAGYDALDKKRIWHLHLKGMACARGLKNCSETFADKGEIDLSGQLRRLLKDGYQESMSLECEFQAPGQSHLETSKRSLEGLLRVVSAATIA